MDDVIIALGKRIRELRLGTGLSQKRMAAKAGLDRTYYAGIERGERNPSVNKPSHDLSALPQGG